MLLLMPVASWGEPTTIERHWARLIATLLQAIHLQVVRRGDQDLPLAQHALADLQLAVIEEARHHLGECWWHAGRSISTCSCWRPEEKRRSSRASAWGRGARSGVMACTSSHQAPITGLRLNRASWEGVIRRWGMGRMS
jgi:hypothetical protein